MVLSDKIWKGDHPSLVYFGSVVSQEKSEMWKIDDIRQLPSNDKSSPGLWFGELKMQGTMLYVFINVGCVFVYQTYSMLIGSNKGYSSIRIFSIGHLNAAMQVFTSYVY